MDEEDSTHPHIAIRDKELLLVCSIDPIAVCEMGEIVCKWLEAVAPPLNPNSPSITQLVGELKIECANWYEIGLSLSVPEWKLAAIKKEDGECLERLTKSLVYWQKNGNVKDDNSFSWETVVKCLRVIDNNTLADDIQKKYLKP